MFRNPCICSTINEAFNSLINSLVNLRIFNSNLGNNLVTESGQIINPPSVNFSNTSNESIIYLIMGMTLLMLIFSRFNMNRRQQRQNINKSN
jgi:hypothetical protein